MWKARTSNITAAARQPAETRVGALGQIRVLPVEQPVSSVSFIERLDLYSLVICRSQFTADITDLGGFGALVVWALGETCGHNRFLERGITVRQGRVVLRGNGGCPRGRQIRLYPPACSARFSNFGANGLNWNGGSRD